MNVEMRPITVADYTGFFGKQPEHTIIGYVFMVNGERVAVCGALLSKDNTMLFSDMKDGVKAPSITVWRWAKKAMVMLEKMNQPLFAISEGSGKFLNSLGFVFRGDTRYGKLYEYLG